MKRILTVLVVLAIIAIATVLYFVKAPRSGHVKDEAMRAGLNASYFKASTARDLDDMDQDKNGPVALNDTEVAGRNTWVIWTAGNDKFWDTMAERSFGALDFLKTLSSYPSLRANRDNRWEYLGLVNEPCFEKATSPDPKRYGLWLDKRSAGCRQDAFENEQEYPGVRIGARGKNIPVGSYYGYASGIVGLRLFPNPDFDEAAEKKWDPYRYYNDPSYYEDKKLIRPYRVGMSCGFCHVGPNPLRPLSDPNHPKWENLSSNVGAQYFWIDRIFYWSGDETNFIYQLFHTSRPGTLDTSLISTDNINNPRTMNAIYSLGPRLTEARHRSPGANAGWGKEKLTGGELDNKQFNDYFTSGPLIEFHQAPDIVWTPRILKDGSDSVGALAALNRVYLNIGTFSEEWLLHFNPLVGGKRITPIKVIDARNNSAYFAATEAQNPAVAAFFLKTTGAHYLKDAPNNAATNYQKEDGQTLTRGKIVFAENCARCHSSKLPPAAQGLDPDGCAGKDYMSCWNRYWDWTKTAEFKDQMRQIVLADDFLKDNYLSAEFRVPVTLLHTNACSPLATNALAGNIWDNFSSQSYKDLPSAGTITWYDPITGEPNDYALPAGGRGYTRPPSLISLWSTAPYLLNNSVGPFVVDPSVDGRMRSFEGSIRQMLWPEQRDHDLILADKVPGRIDRTTTRSYVKVSAGYLPAILRPFLGISHALAPWIFGSGGVVLGPIPAGAPVGLLANLNPLSEESSEEERIKYEKNLFGLVRDLNGDLQRIGKYASDSQVGIVFGKHVKEMLRFSKCPDLVVNRGHYFGTGFLEPQERNPGPLHDRAIADRGEGLSDQDKEALIAFLKTF